MKEQQKRSQKTSRQAEWNQSVLKNTNVHFSVSWQADNNITEDKLHLAKRSHFTLFFFFLVFFSFPTLKVKH